MDGAAGEQATDSVVDLAVESQKRWNETGGVRIALERVMAASDRLVRIKDPAGPPDLRARVDEARRILDATPAADSSVRARLAGILALCELTLAPYENGAMDLDGIRDLVHQGAAGPQPDWQANMSVVRALVDHWSTIGRRGDNAAPDLTALAGIADSLDLTDAVRGVLHCLLPALVANRAHEHGDLRRVDDAVAMLARATGDLDLEFLTNFCLTVRRAQQGGDRGTSAAEMEQLGLQLGRIGPSSTRTFYESLLRALDGAASGRYDLDVARFETTPATVTEALSRTLELWGAYVAAHQNDDRDDMRRVAAAARDLLPHVPAVYLPARIAAFTTAGLADVAVARLDPTDRTAHSRGMEHLAEAMELAGGPEYKSWSVPAFAYAQGLRVDASGRAESRRIGRAVLQAHAWRALLQSCTDAAVESARIAAGDALTVAEWCAQDATVDPAARDDLVAVLDAGRGLVLHAATASRTIPEQLERAGYGHLAAEWRALDPNESMPAVAGPEHLIALPSDLRIRVLRALRPAGATDSSELLEPASTSEIQAALSATGSDALVYLVPAGPHTRGRAVVVPVAGQVDVLPMSDLRDGPGTPLGAFVSEPGYTRDLGPGDSVRPTEAGLDAMCRWAWSACVERLTEHTRQWSLGRPARLVLVPMGKLGLVPWHAACYEHGTDARYAVQDLVVSYSVSGRMFCATANHPVRRPRSVLVVGDPVGDLPFAGIEARAVHRVFYPEGIHMGRDATPDQVLAWIATGRGPSLVHLACHGRINPARPVDAELMLAGGALPARRMLEAFQVADVELDRVFLAACNTNVTGADHDEAVTLATAFLAAGATTVFGSLWTVPDSDTSLLMFMVHHFLNHDHAPVDALRRAQLWMLDPDRKAPAEMPEELLVHSGQTAVGRPQSWAAFMHLGR